MSISCGILVKLKALPGKSDELADFLRTGRDLAAAEPETVTWYAFRVSDDEFGIYDTFEAEDGRTAHLNGRVAAALAAHASELLASDPEIQMVDVIAVK